MVEVEVVEVEARRVEVVEVEARRVEVQVLCSRALSTGSRL